MISFVANRRSQKDFDQMMVMWRWCEAQYGKPDYYQKTWNGDFAFPGNDDYVRFTFYNEAMGTWFAMQFNEHFVVDDEWTLLKDRLCD